MKNETIDWKGNFSSKQTKNNSFKSDAFFHLN